MLSIVLTALLCVAVPVAGRLPPPFDIRIDHHKVLTTKDVVIITARPQISWKLPPTTERNIHQLAYQIQIESDASRWDSGRVADSRSVQVPYTRSDDLEPLTHYRLRVRLWTSASPTEASAWTSWIRFRTSIFNLHEYLTDLNDEVNWIGSTEIYMNELRKEFNVSNASPIRTATAFISGLGYYELFVNGDAVDASRKLDPGWTTYEKRTLFVSYDLTSRIKVARAIVSMPMHEFLPISRLV